MKVTVVDHPLAVERLTVMRDATTPSERFRDALDGLAGMLVYEATRAIEVSRVEVATPLATTTGVCVDRPPLLVPVLRAGLGMLPAALRLLPLAQVGYVGLSRDEATFEARRYLVSVPPRLEQRPALLLDPMLATGGSLVTALEILVERGAGALTAICALAAPEGLARVEASGIDVHVVTASVDERLDERAFIVPGLGDAGDRQFGQR